MSSYMVTKHSWKGKYKRVFSIGSMSITTYNPNSMESTNQWMYSDFISILPAAKGQVTTGLFLWSSYNLLFAGLST